MDCQKNLIIDLDGVLTDGKQYINSDGKKMFKAFHSRDVAAIREFILNGWRVVIVTADGDESGRHFARKVGAEFMVERDKSTVNIPGAVVVGDSAWDIPLMNKAFMAFCPADAGKCLNGIAVPLITNGGAGCIEELLIVLKTSEIL